jgi:ATP synthase mitochondrial F1 complex assembly factor 1
MLWRLRHANDPTSLHAIIPEPVYRKIEATARRHPQFILPIAREIPSEDVSSTTTEKGTTQPKTTAEIHFLQWTFPAPDTVTVLFTHLAEYKLRGEFAQPHTTVTHHLELAGPKGLVLLQGNVVKGRGVSVEEGRWLLMCLQKFYGMEEREERRKLLKFFSEGDERFSLDELIDEADRIL